MEKICVDCYYSDHVEFMLSEHVTLSMLSVQSYLITIFIQGDPGKLLLFALNIKHLLNTEITLTALKL